MCDAGRFGRIRRRIPGRLIAVSICSKAAEFAWASWNTTGFAAVHPAAGRSRAAPGLCCACARALVRMRPLAPPSPVSPLSPACSPSYPPPTPSLPAAPLSSHYST
eukprot:5717808-Prymnesium_polylepis.1